MSSTDASTDATRPPRERKEPLYLSEDAGYDCDMFLLPHHYKHDLAKVLIPKGLVLDRVAKLADDIRRCYGPKTIHLICVLKGGHQFFSDLIQCLKQQHVLHDTNYVPFSFDFIRVKSYEGTASSGSVQIIGGMESLRGRDVLLVEDIIDTGLTMQKLIPVLQEQAPSSIKVASLLEKRRGGPVAFRADFVGFSIPDAFVIGYCLDYNEVFRELEHICIISEAGIAKYRHGLPHSEEEARDTA